MSRRIKLCYKMAKNDSVFIKTYNKQFPKEPVTFSWFDSSVHQGVVAAIYLGYLVGAGRQESLDKLHDK